MGADLYIYNMPRDPQYTGFRTDIEAGYFRDAYNDTNLLSRMELSYWAMTDEHPDWFAKDEDEGYLLIVEGAKGLLDLIRSRHSRLDGAVMDWADEPGDDKYFSEKFDQLVALLEKAIAMDSPVLWSV